jgi:hypothetical protein
MVRDIARDRWREELDSFNRQHEGWLVSIVQMQCREFRFPITRRVLAAEWDR